ncbi:MAG: Murein DD-endopeptidase MepM [Alphaproteobacteria bacterium ADurb.Bin438]|nr:MAG: Murein DD-endopeptidase MepM [Alphaproteobacteria bacterium ADurb.Bin438]
MNKDSIKNKIASFKEIVFKNKKIMLYFVFGILIGSSLSVIVSYHILSNLQNKQVALLEDKILDEGVPNLVSLNEEIMAEEEAIYGEENQEEEIVLASNDEEDQGIEESLVVENSDDISVVKPSEIEEESEFVKEDAVEEETVEVAIEDTTKVDAKDETQDLAENTEEIQSDMVVELNKKESLSSMLKRAGIETNQIYKVSKALSKEADLRKLKPGQKFSLNLDNKGIFILSMEDRDGAVVKVKRIDDNNNYEASKSKLKLETVTASYEGVVNGSFFNSAKKAGMNNKEIALFTSLYKDVISFSKDLRKGDRFRAVYESKSSPSGKIVKDLKILFASFDVKNTEHSRYYYVTNDGVADYYDDKGHSVSRFLTVRPVNARRISSRFGRRVHPVLGHVGFHYGVDYPARTGTPVYAAGDGVVTYVGKKGTYGKYVQIKHNRTYSTAYAHLNGFAKIKKGQRIKKGALIAYVGNTGISTGPHLHFEVHNKGRKVDPLKQYAITEKNLKGKELKSFLAFCAKINPKYAVNSPMNKASIDDNSSKKVIKN